MRLYNKGRRPQGLLLLLLLSFLSPPKAQGRVRPTETSFTDNTKVGLDVGLGVSPLWVVATNKRLDKWFVQKDDAIHKLERNVVPDFRFGVVFGYGFPLNNKWKVGPEIGVNCSFTKDLQAKGKAAVKIRNKGEHTRPFITKVKFKEKRINIPIALQFSAVNENSFLKAKRFSLGYEFSILLSSNLSFSVLGDFNDEEVKPRYWTMFLDVTISPKKMGFPLPTGNFFLEGTLDFPKGFYMAAKLRVPKNLFKLKKHLEALKQKISAFREEIRAKNPTREAANNKVYDLLEELPVMHDIATCSCIEFNLGLDIMKLIF